MATDLENNASTDIARFLIDSYRTDRGVHAETIIGGAAALAGEFALRACAPNLPDRGWVVGGDTNGLLFEDEAKGETTLWTIIRLAAEKIGAAPADLPDPEDVVGSVASSVGRSPFPPLSVPGRHYPHEWSPNACPRLRRGIEEIGAAKGRSARQLALDLAMAIAILLKETKDILPTAIGATLALEIMIGVSRMAPMKEEIRKTA